VSLRADKNQKYAWRTQRHGQIYDKDGYALLLVIERLLGA
jgi:hypothetical protein